MKSPIQLILSNCRIFLNNKNKEMERFEKMSNDNKLSKTELIKLRSNISNVDLFDIAKVMTVALANRDFLAMLIAHEDASYSVLPESIYKMACRNLAAQIRTDREMKAKIQRMRSKERIQEAQDMILDMDAFSLSQIIAIAFMKDGEVVDTILKSYTDFMKMCPDTFTIKTNK